jgi:hypothetical protein
MEEIDDYYGDLNSVGPIILDFIHSEEGGNSSQIIFTVNKILHLGPQKLIMKGDGIINRHASKPTIIVYKIQKKKFYWVGYYNEKNHAMRIMREIILPEGQKGTYLKNAENKQKLFSFINDCIQKVNKKLPQLSSSYNVN